MPRHVMIDGNNLLFAMHTHAPLPNIGRETLVKVIDRWARGGDDNITLVFDGPAPRGGLSQQMTSSRVVVLFSAPRTADDLIVAAIHRERHPDQLRVISSDTAIRHEAHMRRCGHVDCIGFIRELFATQPGARSASAGTSEKPGAPTPDESQAWIETFGLADTEDDDEPFDGFNAMTR